MVRNRVTLKDSDLEEVDMNEKKKQNIKKLKP